MSLVTRCTSCGTLFKVVADQLKISEGWVRCGQCATVFDAQANLQVSPPNATPSPPSAPSARFSSPSLPQTPSQIIPATPSPALQETQAISPQPAVLGSLKEDSQHIARRVHAQPIDSGAGSPVSSSSASASFQPGALRNAADLDSETGPSTASWAASDYAQISALLSPAETRSETSSEAPFASADSINTSAASVLATPSVLNSSVPANTWPEDLLKGNDTATAPDFVQQAQRAARWRSPWMRLSLSLVGLVLLTLLTLQVVIQEKDRIAALRPNTQAWLEQLCVYADCQVQALKRIEALTVDASSFNRINKNNAVLEAVTQSFKLAVTLKNTDTVPIAAPHIELSLQDTQDQPILRRVLSPADLGIMTDVIAASQDMQGSLTLQIDTLQLAGKRIHGYRVLAFYP